MKIISKFKDYYDNMRCYSMCSDDFTYIRNTDDHLIGKEIIPQTLDLEIFKRDHKIKFLLIGFCGKIYPIFKVEISENYTAKKYKIFFDFEKAIEFCIDKKYLNRQIKNNQIKSWRYGGKKNHNVEGIIKYYKNKYDKDYNKLNQYFEEYNTPVFILQRNYRETLISINPRLKDFEFYKIFEGHQAYQEIEMYIGNILLKPDDPDQITDDKILAQNHGFDKWSFKKLPTKKKQ